MKEEKIKILKMVENKKINIYEAIDLLDALEESHFNKMKNINRKGKKIFFIYKDNKNNIERDTSFVLEDIYISAIMNKINSEFKYFGLDFSMDDLKKIKENLFSRKKTTFTYNDKKIEVFVK